MADPVKLAKVPIWYCAGQGCRSFFIGSARKATTAGWELGASVDGTGQDLCKMCVGRVPALEVKRG